jgi:hypothetical protein
MPDFIVLDPKGNPVQKKEKNEYAAVSRKPLPFFLGNDMYMHQPGQMSRDKMPKQLNPKDESQKKPNIVIMTSDGRLIRTPTEQQPSKDKPDKTTNKKNETDNKNKNNTNTQEQQPSGPTDYVVMGGKVIPIKSRTTKIRYESLDRTNAKTNTSSYVVVGSDAIPFTTRARDAERYVEPKFTTTTTTLPIYSKRHNTVPPVIVVDNEPRKHYTEKLPMIKTFRDPGNLNSDYYKQFHVFVPDSSSNQFIKVQRPGVPGMYEYVPVRETLPSETTRSLPTPPLTNHKKQMPLVLPVFETTGGQQTRLLSNPKADNAPKIYYPINIPPPVNYQAQFTNQQQQFQQQIQPPPINHQAQLTNQQQQIQPPPPPPALQNNNFEDEFVSPNWSDVWPGDAKPSSPLSLQKASPPGKKASVNKNV